MKITLAHIKNGIVLNVVILIILSLVVYFWYFRSVRIQHLSSLSHTIGLEEIWENIQVDPLNNVDNSGKSLLEVAPIGGEGDFSFADINNFDLNTIGTKFSVDSTDNSDFFGGYSSTNTQVFKEMLPSLSHLIDDEDPENQTKKQQLITDILSQPLDSEIPYIDWLSESLQDDQVGEYIQNQKQEL